MYAQQLVEIEANQKRLEQQLTLETQRTTHIEELVHQH